MRRRTVTAVFPYRFSSGPTVVLTASRVPVPPAGPTVNDAVAFFERVLFRDAPRSAERVGERVPLEGIVNLHDADGMKNLPQISGMIGQISAAGDIIHPTGLPNAMVVLAERGEQLLFNGHHTVIAYMAAGREYLDEIPHLVVHDDNGRVEDAAILAFFGAHATKLAASDWRNHVINWYAPPDRQLCRRTQRNMGELFEALAGGIGPFGEARWGGALPGERPGVRPKAPAA